MMKPLAESKSRLAPALASDRRFVLSLSMLVRVVAACSAVGHDMSVVGGDEIVQRAARRLGASWRAEPAPGLNAALGLLMKEVSASDYGATVYLPADLPLIGQEDVQALLSQSGDAQRFAIAPDRSGKGTNALVIPAGCDFTPGLGDNSFAYHTSEALRLGFEPFVCHSPGLTLDVDTPKDLEYLIRKCPKWWQEADAVLGRLGLLADGLVGQRHE